jgi:hypothetical protein
MYLALVIVVLLFIFFLKKSRTRYRIRDYKRPAIIHGVIILLVNIAFEIIYRAEFVPTQAGSSSLLTYVLPQVIYYLLLITVFLAMAYSYGFFIWPDDRNAINRQHNINIPICFILTLFILYPSFMRNGLVESSSFLLVCSLIGSGITSIYLVRIFVIKFNTNQNKY